MIRPQALDQGAVQFPGHFNELPGGVHTVCTRGVRRSCYLRSHRHRTVALHATIRVFLV